MIPDPPSELSTKEWRPKCSICGRTCATIRLTLRQHDAWLIYEGPGRWNGHGDPVSIERARAITRAFTEPYSAAAIRGAGLYDNAGFCVECGAFYCSACWDISSTGGSFCPKARHFKSVDPHWHPED